MVCLESLLRVSESEIKVSARLNSNVEALGDNPLLSSIQMVGKNQFLVVVGLMPLLSYWLTAGG